MEKEKDREWNMEVNSIEILLVEDEISSNLSVVSYLEDESFLSTSIR